ncbi:MAG: Holliday junction resolvase RuvX [Lentisphaerae bacterium]|nr:Holliday junction resolvase RuvX [Lentisphaerota bacterium]
MPRTLGVDYGERRVGLAISDEAGLLALPLDILPAQNSRQVIQDILSLCREKEATAIVVGLPLNMDGSRGTAVEAVEQFAQELRRQTSLSVKTWDERLSSQQVERTLIAADVSRARRKKLTDKLAAQVILQSYLDAQEMLSRQVCSRAREGVDSSGGHGLTPAAT